MSFDSYLRVGHHDAAEAQCFEVTRETLTVLCDVIGHRGAVDKCFFAIWEGHGWVDGGGGSLIGIGWGGESSPDSELIATIEAANSAPAFPDGVLSGPKLSLPNRSYYVFEGPLDSALDIGHRKQILDREHFEPHAPDLIWPRDHSWFIGTDTDLWFAYLGGSSALVHEILGEAQLESRAVSASDWLGDVELH
jgi:hypothetical protein